jgi:P27 family predicted phage terminase small subunit
MAARQEPRQPYCFPELGPVARREWDRLSTELASLGPLTTLDRSALGAYCGAYALWAEATEAIPKYGTMVKSPSGYPVQSPYVSIANRQAEIMMRIASEFGFTPASRSRISTPASATEPLFDLSTGQKSHQNTKVHPANSGHVCFRGAQSGHYVPKRAICGLTCTCS